MINIAEIKKIHEGNEEILDVKIVGNIDGVGELKIIEYSNILKEFNEFRRRADTLSFIHNELMDLCRENSKNHLAFEAKLESYLSATLKFIDTWEKEIKKRFSYLSLNFKEQKENIYDNFFEYRFIYNLRNFSQHVGNSLSYVVNSIYSDAEIIFSKEYFLKNHSGMQPSFRKELESSNIEVLNITNAVKVCTDELIKLHNNIVKTIIDNEKKYVEAAINVDSFYRYYNKEGGILVLTKFDLSNFKENSETKFDFFEVPNNFSEVILNNVIIKWQ